jgi:hypothetical protein
MMMVEDGRTEKLRRLAAEMILEASSLTDGLTDEEARPLIAWALSQGEAAADALAASVDLASLPAGETREMLAGRVAPVRRFMGAINALAGERRELKLHRAYKRLESIRVMAQELPAPPDVVSSDLKLKWLARRTRKDDDSAFVRTIVLMLASTGGRLEQIRIGSGSEYVFRKK